MYLYTVKVDFYFENYTPERETSRTTLYVGEKLSYTVARQTLASIKERMEERCPPWRSRSRKRRRQGLYSWEGKDKSFVSIDSKTEWWRRDITSTITLEELCNVLFDVTATLQRIIEQDGQPQQS